MCAKLGSHSCDFSIHKASRQCAAGHPQQGITQQAATLQQLHLFGNRPQDSGTGGTRRGGPLLCLHCRHRSFHRGVHILRGGCRDAPNHLLRRWAHHREPPALGRCPPCAPVKQLPHWHLHLACRLVILLEQAKCAEGPRACKTLDQHGDSRPLQCGRICAAISESRQGQWDGEDPNQCSLMGSHVVAAGATVARPLCCHCHTVF